MWIHDLHAKFRDEKNLDKTIQAHSALDKVTSVMKNNIAKIMDNRVDIEGLEGKSTNIRDAASNFRMKS